MRFDLKRRLYESSPLWLQKPMGWIPISLVAGAEYRRVIRDNNRIDTLNRQECLDLQEKLLGETLDFATAWIPFYRKYRSAFEKLRPFEAIREIPAISKAQMQTALDEFLPGNLSQIPHYQVTTGGTSGNQLAIYHDNHMQAMETAYNFRMFGRMGYSPTDRKATFRGVSFPNLPMGVFWKLNPVYHEVQFSPFHMSDANLPAYTKKLAEWKPTFIHGYPSAVDILAHHLLNGGDNRFCSHLRGILMGSEGCLPGQRERIEKAFRCRTFTWYGHTERALLAGECENGRIYHQFPDYGFLEIRLPDGTMTREPGAAGELVGTGFLNRSMPFIRYRTGDFATLNDPECNCGRHWDRFTGVQGRWDQLMVQGHSGARISIAALNMHGSIFDHVLRYQYFQDQPGICQIRVMPAPDFSPADASGIETAFKQKVGDELDVVVRIVEDIPLTAGGKVRLLELATSTSN